MKQIIMQNYQLTIKIILQCCAFSYKIFVNYKNSLTVHENLNLKNFENTFYQIKIKKCCRQKITNTSLTSPSLI